MATWVIHLMTARAARTRLGTADYMAVMSTAAAATTLLIAVATGSGADLGGLSARAGSSSSCSR